MDHFIPTSPEIYNYSYFEKSEITDKFLLETQQQNHVLRQIHFWKQ